MEGRVSSGQGRVIENFAKNHSRDRNPARKDDNRKRHGREVSFKSEFTPNEKKALRAIRKVAQDEGSDCLVYSLRWWGKATGLRRDIFKQMLWKLCRKKLIRVTTQMDGDIRRIQIQILKEVQE